jgi:hypothetical protein
MQNVRTHTESNIFDPYSQQGCQRIQYCTGYRIFCVATGGPEGFAGGIERFSNLYVWILEAVCKYTRAELPDMEVPLK